MCFAPDGSVLQQIEVGFSGEQTWLRGPNSPKPLSTEEINFFKNLDVSIDNVE